MTWKIAYDFRRPHWLAFGRIVFVDANEEADALIAGRAAAQAVEPDAEIIACRAQPSSPEAAARYAERLQALRTWRENVLHGIPNRRHALPLVEPSVTPDKETP